MHELYQLYPTLYFERTSFLSLNYDVLISNKKLNQDDYNTSIKLGQLLGYPPYNDYPISKKNKNNGYYIYNVTVNLIKKNKCSLFSFVAKDTSMEKDIYKLLLNIQNCLQSHPVHKYIKKIYIIRYKKKLDKILETSYIN